MMDETLFDFDEELVVDGRFGDHYEVIADWLRPLLETELATGEVRLLQDRHYAGKCLVISLEDNWCIELELTERQVDQRTDSPIQTKDLN